MSEKNQHSPSSGKIFETVRLDLVAFLLCEGFALVSVKAGIPTVAFRFNDPEEQAESAQLRFQSGAKVSANTFSDAIRRTRELVFDAKRLQKGKQHNANRNSADNTTTA
jgi:hypothetical protein